MYNNGNGNDGLFRWAVLSSLAAIIAIITYASYSFGKKSCTDEPPTTQLIKFAENVLKLSDPLSPSWSSTPSHHLFTDGFALLQTPLHPGYHEFLGHVDSTLQIIYPPKVPSQISWFVKKVGDDVYQITTEEGNDIGLVYNNTTKTVSLQNVSSAADFAKWKLRKTSIPDASDIIELVNAGSGEVLRAPPPFSHYSSWRIYGKLIDKASFITRHYA